MQKFYIPPTKTSFEISFDPGENLLEIAGISYPANARDFFKPVEEWVDGYLANLNSESVNISFRVSYFNTSSSKYLYQILAKFSTYHKEKGNVKILWHHMCEKENVLEAWKELAFELDIAFEVVTIDE